MMVVPLFLRSMIWSLIKLAFTGSKPEKGSSKLKMGSVKYGYHKLYFLCHPFRKFRQFFLPPLVDVKFVKPFFASFRASFLLIPFSSPKYRI
jgi:hypothetical protein